MFCFNEGGLMMPERKLKIYKREFNYWLIILTVFIIIILIAYFNKQNLLQGMC